MNYLEVSALVLFAIMGASVVANWLASAALLSRLRHLHPDVYREVGEPRLFPSLRAPFASHWSPSFPPPGQLAKLNDPQALRLLRIVRTAGWIALAVLCFTILVQFPAAWIISAGCESGDFSRICP